MPSPMPKGWLATITSGTPGSITGGQDSECRTRTPIRSSIRPKMRLPLGAISVFQIP